MPGEEARVSNACLCSLTNVAWYVLISYICWWPEGFQITNEDSTSQYEYISCIGFTL